MNAINRPTRVLGIEDMKRELADVERCVSDVARLCSPRGNAILTKQVQRLKDVRLNLLTPSAKQEQSDEENQS